MADERPPPRFAVSLPVILILVAIVLIVVALAYGCMVEPADPPRPHGTGALLLEFVREMYA